MFLYRPGSKWLTFISTCLDYCNLLYSGLLLKTIQKVPLMQNAEVKLFDGWTCYCRMSSICSFYTGSRGLLSIIHGTAYYLYTACCNVRDWLVQNQFLSLPMMEELWAWMELLKASPSWKARRLWAGKASLLDDCFNTMQYAVPEIHFAPSLLAFRKAVNTIH